MPAFRCLLSAWVVVLCSVSAPIEVRADFGYRMSLTLDRTRVGESGTENTTLANFPMLVSVQLPELRTQANGGHVVSAEGHDIVFRALDTTTCGGDAVCTLDHELESYEPATGRLVAWVRVPSVNTNLAGTDTVVYLYYGNSEITSSTQRPQAVWGSAYEAVWHMSQDPSGTAPQILDSTSNGRHGTSVGSMTSGDLVACQVQQCLDFDDVNDYIDTGDYMSGLSALSVEAWVYRVGSGDDRVISKASSVFPDSNYIFSLGVTDTGRLRGRLATGGASAATFTGVTTMSQNTWYHVAMSWDGTDLSLFLNGEREVTGDKSGTLSSNTQPVVIGNNDAVPNARYWGGLLDEVRLGNVGKSGDYLKTSYNNQSSPSTFHAVGAEEDAPQFAVGFAWARAYREGAGTRVAWQVAHETDNLGFAVWKKRTRGWVRLGKDLIASHSLRSSRTVGYAATDYEFVDDGPVSLRAPYAIEAVDARGRSSWHGPVPVSDAPASVRAEPGRAPTPTLSQLRGVWSAFPPRRRRAPVGGAPTVLAQAGPPHALAVSIEDTGVHRLSGAALLAQGLPVGTPLEAFALAYRGAPVPLLLEDDGDGLLSSRDALLFWGEHRPTLWSAQTVFALTWRVGGARVKTRLAPAPEGAQPVEEGSSVWAHAPKSLYLAALNNGPRDNFVGPLIGTNGVVVPLTLPDRVAERPSHIRIELQGVSLVPHDVELRADDEVVGTTLFEGRSVAVAELSLPAQATLSLRTRGGPADMVAISSVRVTYARAARPTPGGTVLEVPSGSAVALAAGGKAARLWLLTNDEVTELRAPASGSVVLPGQGVHEVVLWEGPVPHEPALGVPAPYRADTQTELLIIAPAAFHETLGPYVALREAQGLRVALTTPQAIYDAYASGHKDPEAIRAALEATFLAREWGFVLLVGDGHFDPLDHLGKGLPDLIPVPTRNARGLETAYDDYYADFDGDGRPNVALGRLPVQDVEQLAVVLETLRRFEATDTNAWTDETLMLTGDDEQIDLGALGEGFKTAMGTANEHISFAGDPVLARGSLLEALSRPARLITYFGHGSVETWGRQNLFSSKEAATLVRETGPPSVFALLTCLNGFFHDLFSRSLAESLLTAPHGPAVAVWASTGMTDPVVQQRLSEALARQVNRSQARRLGDAIRAARAELPVSDTSLSFTLLGDPSLLLPWVPAGAEAPAPSPEPPHLPPLTELPPVPASPPPATDLPASPPPAADPPFGGCSSAGGGPGSPLWLLVVSWLWRARRRPS
ncbi:MAG: hypothetical protein KA712_07120 [Myxococcales bacterium]|nr:hypothetical protein [Myxococcales bacterium]